MCRSPSHLNHRSISLAALASLASLAVAGCGGEQAARARDGGVTSGAAGTTGTGGSHGGAGGSMGGTGGDITGVAGGGTSGGGSSGTGGSGAGGSAGAGTGTGGSGPGVDGTPCSSGTECMSGWCTDNFCCHTECAGTCVTCAGTPKGSCLPIANDTPSDDCPMALPMTCGNTGKCDGAGKCQKYGANVDCNNTPACDAAKANVVPKQVCNGTGQCVNAGMQSCNGFLCSDAGGTAVCGSSCTDDTACVTGGFCGAGLCVGKTPNLAGNGDLEYGTTSPWVAASGASNISLVTAPALVHAGQNAILDANRTRSYQGQGYSLPTGVGTYNISAWVMQKDWTATIGGLLTVVVNCRDALPMPYYLNFPTVSMPQNTWVMVNGTLDLTTSMTPAADCGPATGLVRAAQLYLNQNSQSSPCGMDSGATMACPDLYMDDLVVTVTDGHNLIGNPSFEGGAVDGWGVSALSAKNEIVTTVAHDGTHSLHEYQRTTPQAGPRYTLPIGYARYNVSFWVMHNGTVNRTLILQPTYTCIGGTAQTPTATVTATNVAPGTWTHLNGTITLPPADATPQGCKMVAASVYVTQDGVGGMGCGTGAGQVECPDLFLDEATITMAQ